MGNPVSLQYTCLFFFLLLPNDNECISIACSVDFLNTALIGVIYSFMPREADDLYARRWCKALAVSLVTELKAAINSVLFFSTLEDKVLLDVHDFAYCLGVQQRLKCSIQKLRLMVT